MRMQITSRSQRANIVRVLQYTVAVGIVASVLLGLLLAPVRSASPRSKDKPYGIEKRVPWTTSRVRGSPEPPPPYVTESAFPKLKFDEPLEMVSAPGSDRLFVVERYGKIYSFPVHRDVA